MDALTHLTALRELYAGYEEAYRQRLADNGPLHGLHKFLLGNSTPSDRKADTGFYKAVEKTADALRLTIGPDEDFLAEQAVRLMVLEAKGVDPSSTLMVEATQPLAIPLLSHLTRESAGEILAAYRARYPKKRMLSPKQKELLAALEQAAT